MILPSFIAAFLYPIRLEWAVTAAGRWTHRSAGASRETGIRLLAISKGVKLICKGNGKVAGEIVILGILDIVGGNRTTDVKTLLQYIVGIQSNSGNLSAEELISQ